MGSQPMGCLGFLFKLIGFGEGAEVSPTGSAGGTEVLPYRQRDNFLSAAELNFFRVLKPVTESHFHVCSKVRISDLLYVVNRNKNMGHANRIDRKHVDFVLCDPKTMQPVLVVELDDSSHQRADRQARDKLVDSAFAAANLSILHVTCRRQYSPEDLTKQIREALNQEDGSGENAPPTPPPLPPTIAAEDNAGLSSQDATPECPKCNVAMVGRTAASGKRFWACPSYPECRRIVAID